jgi:hypothetical protein
VASRPHWGRLGYFEIPYDLTALFQPGPFPQFSPKVRPTTLTAIDLRNEMGHVQTPDPPLWTARINSAYAAFANGWAVERSLGGFPAKSSERTGLFGDHDELGFG